MTKVYVVDTINEKECESAIGKCISVLVRWLTLIWQLEKMQSKPK